MDLKGYTTVDEVGEDPQVRNVENFKPATAAEEIDYLNKILAKIEKCEVKENSEGGKYNTDNAMSEKDTQRNDSCNNNAVNPMTQGCSVYVNIQHRDAEYEQNCIRNESRDKLELHIEKCSLNEMIDERNFDFNESDILTQAESQHSVIQENKSGHVQNELSTEPSLMMANPSVTDLEGNSKQNSRSNQSKISSNAEVEEKLETYSIESITLQAPNENGSSELSSSTMEATIMPVNCSAESSSVLESGNYSAKDTFDFVSGEDISGSSNLDSVELGDVSSLSNVVLGDIGSLLESSADHLSVTEENTAADCATQIDLSIVKSEPVCSDPGEEFDLQEFCSDPAEEFVLKEHSIKEEPKEHSIKEEPMDYSPPAPTVSQEEVLLPVKIFKSEDDSDEQIITPNIRYLVEDHKQYSREEVAAALIISQSSLSPIIDMEMFQNLGRTKLTVKLSRLENVMQRPKKLALEDFNVLQLFRSNYGTSIQEWKNFFIFKANYSVKHTGKRISKKHTNNVSSDKRKGKRGRKKKCMTDKSHNKSISSTCNSRTHEVKDVVEETDKGDHQLKHIEQSRSACPVNEEKVQLKEEADEESSCDFKNSSKLEVESETLREDSVNIKKRKRKLDGSGLGNEEETSNEGNIKDEKDELILQCADLSASYTLNDNLEEEDNKKKLGVSHQLSDSCKACSVHLYDIANDPVYGESVRKYLKQSNERSRVLGHVIEEPLKESFKDNEISPTLLEKQNNRDEVDITGKPVEESFKENEISPPLFENETKGDEVDADFTDLSPGQLKEQMAFLLRDVKDLVANAGKVNFDLKEMQHKTSLKENENAGETAETNEISMVEKESPEISFCRENITTEMGIKVEKEAETELKLKRKVDRRLKLETEDEFQKEKDERKARKKMKFDVEDVDGEIKSSPRDRKKVLPENDFHRGKSETDQEMEGNSLKYNIGKKDEVTGFADLKKDKEDILTSKDRNPIPSSLSSLGSFKIPKKKVTQVREHKTQEHNSILHRRETHSTQKSVVYSSNKHVNIQSKKKDCKERASCNLRNMKKEIKPVIPASTQPPVVEGWAKASPLPSHTGGYHPQAGFPNMYFRNRCPAPVAHPVHGNFKAQLETVNQIRMHTVPHMGHIRQPVIAKAEHNNLPSSNYSVMNIDKPVKQISIPMNIPPPPPLEKLDLNSPKLGQGSGNIQPLSYEPSPVMSYGNSSDGESDVTEICKPSLTGTQPPLSNVTDTPNTDTAMTERCQASLSRAVPPARNVPGTPDNDVTEIHKENLFSTQPPQTNMVDTPNKNTSSCATDISRQVIPKPRQRELYPRTAHEQTTKDKVETAEGASTKDHYQLLDKKQKIKLYEKRKKYYYEAKKRYHVEKGDRKKAWCKEYEKRKNDYYHLKIYLYKEKKREYMEKKLLRKSLETHSNDDDRTSEALEEDSQLNNEVEVSEDKEENSNTALEAEEIPYSPTASPIDYDEDFYSINVQASLLDDAPGKQTVDGKDQEGTPLFNYSTEQLKDMIMQVMNTLHQQSENQSADSTVKSDEYCESKDVDKPQPLNSTSIPSPAKTSESPSFPSTSLPLPLQQTSVTVPPVTVSSTSNEMPLPVPPPSLIPFSLPPLVFSKGAHKDSVLTVPVSSTAVSPPQPVPPPVSSLPFSSTSNKHLTHEQSSPCVENVSGSKSVSTAEFPLSAPQVEHKMVEKSHFEVQKDHSVSTSPPESDILLPPLPQPEKEFATECLKLAQEDSGHLPFPHSEVFPPLPPLPPPPPPEEDITKEIPGSVVESKDRLHEHNVSDDMTEVPMDIDSDMDNHSDNETINCLGNDGDDNTTFDYHGNVKYDNIMPDYHDDADNVTSDCHTNRDDSTMPDDHDGDNVTSDCHTSVIDDNIMPDYYDDADNVTSDCHTNVRDENVMPDYHDSVQNDNVMSDCHDNFKDVMSDRHDSDTGDNEVPDCRDNDKGDIKAANHCNSDKEFLSLFGICQNKSPSLEKEPDENSIDNSHMTKLLKKLMKVSNTNKPVDTHHNKCGPNAGMEATSDSPLGKASTCFNLATVNQQVEDCNPLREQDAPSVSSSNLGKTFSPAQNKDIVTMCKQMRKGEVISTSSYKQDEKGMPFETAQRESLKNEIEIIEMKEPPKNLICVDEILLSVEAADQPVDLQIIYTDLRNDPRDKRHMIRDEVPKYYQKTALAQMLVDKCKDIPLVGLQYVLEVRKDFDMTLDGCYYICAVCSKKMTAHTLVAHIKSVPHRLKFSETHCKHIHEKYASYELKEWTASLVKEFTMNLAEIEKKMGRHKLAVAFERDMPSVLKSLKQKIGEISNLSKLQEDKAKVPVDQAPSSVASAARKVSEPITSIADGVKDVPLQDSALPKSTGASVLSNNDIPLPPKLKSPGSKGGSVNKNYDDDDEDIILVSITKNDENAKKFSSNGQGFTKRNYRPGPNARSKSSSRSTTPTLSPRKSKSRTKSPSPKKNIPQPPSNKQMKRSRSPHRKPDRPLYVAGRKRRNSRSPVSPRRRSRSRSTSRDKRKRYRTRSRSRSRHRSPYRRMDSRSRRSPPHKRESSEERKRRVSRRKLEDFREAEVKIRAKHKNQQIVYEKTPESHPLYNREWKIFWERRCRELEKEGVDPFLHDFKSEWARFWHHRMKELMDKNFNFKRDALLRKFRMEDPDLEEKKKSSNPPSSSWRPGENVERLSRIDRSPSPWEQDESAPAIARNPSPVPGKAGNSKETKGSSKSMEISTSKFEDDFSVIGTLKLLNELEDQLGSFGPAISTLLGKAVDCSQKGEDTLELFKDPDNLVLVRYAREKLSSQISAGILGVTSLLRTQMAVERSMWLQSQAEKLANEGKYLGLDIAGIARATLGRDTVQIAQYIAQHLLQVGKSNASESDLQNILYAVLAAHTKLLVETSKKAQVDTPVEESAAPVPAPVITVSDDPPKELPSTPSETSEVTKQPLFPSMVAGDKSEKDKGVDDGDSSNKLGGLSLLQNAYEEENGKEMENLSLDDLRSLLANFSSLNKEEKQALTTYLKKLEATDSKKVMKLREEIQKSAKNTAKAGNMKSTLKSGKSSARSQSAPNTDSNNQASQQQPLEATQVSSPEKKYCPEMPAFQTNEENMRPHSMDNGNQPVGVPQDRFIGGSETDVIHDSRNMLGPSGNLDHPPHNMPPAPSPHNMPMAQSGMSEMRQDFGPNISHKPDQRPHHIDQPRFEDDRHHAFPQRPFMERHEPGFGMSDPYKHNVSNHDRKFDRFGYEPVQRPNNPMGPQNCGRYDRPPEPNNPPWQGFGRGGPRMDDRGFPPRDEMKYNWFDDGPQPPYEQRDFAPRGRPDYSFSRGPRRGHYPNTRQPYREPW